ncbi:PAX3- and PAX7-binding protein 1-like [Lineus longissimus]|uniref:PAX3- and PAX7-binding protein 1-like n=1 Tax=Lineus longissimus TaxID=88925 RepID=UPI002B4D369B
MFKKPKKNFRRRVVEDSDEEKPNDGAEPMDIEDQTDEAPASEIPKIPKEKSKKSDQQTPKKSKNVLLSFDHDHEEEAEPETFKVKKSSRSQKIARQIKKESKREKEENEIKRKEEERLQKELKEKRESSGRRGRGRDRDNSDSENDRRVRNGSDMDTSGSDSEKEEKEKKRTSHAFRGLLERGEIPDANLIHLAKKKRQQAREQGDFIPLEETKPVKSASRLIREDEHDASSDEERVSFSANVQAQERALIRDRFLAVEHGSDVDSDQENDWEAQQIKKAVSIPQTGAQTDKVSVPDQYFYNQTGSVFSSTTGYIEPPSVVPTSSRKTPPLKSEEITLEQMKATLKDRLMSLGQVHRAHILEKDRIDGDKETNVKTAIELEGKVSSLEEQYKFFQEMRGYVRDLVECLDEKVPQIYELESNYFTLMRERAEKLVKRRQQDITDQSTDYNPNKSKIGQFNDEKHRRLAEREARRSRRRRARESKLKPGHYDGLSTDDEENQSDLAKFNMERDRILSESSTLFDDVVDDFSRIRRIKGRFEQWKFQHGESYREAYIGLCLPKLYMPLIRLHLITWNPLEVRCADFERMPWFQTLMFYGFKEGDAIDPNDADVKLLPSVIEKVLLPKLTAYIESVWDPLSSSETRSLVAIVKKITAEYPLVADCKNMLMLGMAAVDRIKRSLDGDVFIPLYPKSVVDNKSSPASMFFHRQLWSCIKLFTNILMWDTVLSATILRDLAFGGLLNRYILLGLGNSVYAQFILKCQMICVAIPKSWFAEAPDESTIKPLENFCRFLASTASVIDKDIGMEGDKRDGRDTIKQITKLLVNLHSMDNAMNLANQFSLKL